MIIFGMWVVVVSGFYTGCEGKVIERMGTKFYPNGDSEYTYNVQGMCRGLIFNQDFRASELKARRDKKK